MEAQPSSPALDRRYELREKIGAGGMGEVYRARDRLTGAQLALKRVTVPADDLMFSTKGQGTDPRLALAQEFRTLSSLRHPHIISVLDYGFDEEKQPFFTMSLLEHAHTILEAGQHASREVKTDLVIQMLQALSYLHRRGVIHHDLKPGNVLVVNGEVRLLDFGLSVDIERSSSQKSGAMVGTFAYLAPELLRGRAASKATDLYAIGIIIYELFAGKHPFDTSNPRALLHDILNKAPDLSIIVEGTEIAGLLERLTAKNPEDRYKSVDEVIHHLCDAMGKRVPPETKEIRESYLKAARFVGRDEEMVRLSKALDRALEGAGSTCLIAGESGVGKTRLTEELRAHALVKGALVLVGQAVSEGGRPYHLWREIAKRLSIMTGLQLREASVLKQLVPEISQLLERDVPDAPPLDPQSAQYRLSRTLGEVVKRQCSMQPVVLILEDLQWAESNSLVLLESLLSLSNDQSLFILGNFRDDERPELPNELPATQKLKLSRLTEHAIIELSGSMIGEAGRSDRIVQFLERETEGNPFFLVETVRALAEDVEHLDEIATRDLPERIFAGGIRDVIDRRLSKVPEEAKPLLQLAATAGRNLDFNILRILVPETDVDAWFSRCVDAAVLEVKGDLQRFSHDKFREGLLETIPESAWRPSHQRVAEAIEKVYPDDATQVSALAYLWGVAGDNEKELHYSRLAGEQAVLNNANTEAVRYFERALRLLETFPESTERDRLELSLQTGIAIPHLTIKGWGSKEQEHVVERAWELSEKLGDTPELFQLLWFTCNVTSGIPDYPAAWKHHKHMSEIAERLGDQGMKIVTHWAAGIVYAFTGIPELTLASTDKALRLFNPDQHQILAFQYGQSPGISSTSISAWALWNLGYPEKALERNQRALTLAEELSHPLTTACTLCLDSWIHLLLWNDERAFESARACVDHTEEHGLPLLIAWGSVMLGSAMILRGRIDEGIEAVREGVVTCRTIGYRMGLSIWLGFIAITCLRAGAVKEAVKAANESLDFTEKTGDGNLVSECYRVKGEAALGEDDQDNAESFFDKALEWSRQRKSKALELRAATSMSRLWRRQGKSSEARQLLERIYNQFTEGFDTADLKEAKTLLDELVQ